MEKSIILFKQQKLNIVEVSWAAFTASLVLTQISGLESVTMHHDGEKEEEKKVQCTTLCAYGAVAKNPNRQCRQGPELTEQTAVSHRKKHDLPQNSFWA